MERKIYKLGGEVIHTVDTVDGETLAGVNLVSENLKCAKLFHENLKDANLAHAYLAEADFRSAKLQGANLTRAVLVKANLESADLTGANLTLACLEGAKLKGAILKGADLTRANLTGADLRGANLTGANLKTANLKKANFGEYGVVECVTTYELPYSVGLVRDIIAIKTDKTVLYHDGALDERCAIMERIDEAKTWHENMILTQENALSRIETDINVEVRTTSYSYTKEERKKIDSLRLRRSLCLDLRNKYTRALNSLKGIEEFINNQEKENMKEKENKEESVPVFSKEQDPDLLKKWTERRIDKSSFLTTDPTKESPKPKSLSARFLHLFCK